MAKSVGIVRVGVVVAVAVNNGVAVFVGVTVLVKVGLAACPVCASATAAVCAMAVFNWLISGAGGSAVDTGAHAASNRMINTKKGVRFECVILLLTWAIARPDLSWTLDL